MVGWIVFLALGALAVVLGGAWIVYSAFTMEDKTLTMHQGDQDDEQD